MEMSKFELENALVAAMQSAMTLGDSDDSMETQSNDDHDRPPTEHLQVRVHQYNISHQNSIRIVLEDYMVESVMYYGTDQLGDQDQYALTPNKAILQMSFTELLGNTWIEFLITNAGNNSVSIWLRTEYIYMIDPSLFPMSIELVDNDYKYVVRSSVLLENQIFYFKNLCIQTIQ
jgi:hypothetical protein